MMLLSDYKVTIFTLIHGIWIYNRLG